jgi:putative ABC transport system substrate-binding protein
VKRREFITLVCNSVAAWPFATRAQHAEKVPRIGYLSPSSTMHERDESFRQGLRELGYVEGKNIVLSNIGSQERSSNGFPILRRSWWSSRSTSLLRR